MRSIRYIALFSTAAFAASLCWADDDAGGADAKKQKKAKHPDIGQVDTNADGKVSFEELKAKYPKLTEEKFKARDKNGDGFITQDERGAGEAKAKPDAAPSVPQTAEAPKREPGQMFKMADKDGDGKVTWDEVHAAAPRFPETRFKQLDANSDGAITKDEMASAKAPGGEPGKPREGGLFLRADKDKDGKVTFEEASAVLPSLTREKFDALDKDHDGALLPGDALKGGEGGGGKPDIAQLARRADADHNGKVTFDEMHAVMPELKQERFDAMDLNKDGVLSPEDRAMADREGKEGKGGAAARLLETDPNKDGKVSFDEIAAAKPGFPREAFDKADTNKDGVVSSDDVIKK